MPLDGFSFQEARARAKAATPRRMDWVLQEESNVTTAVALLQAFSPPLHRTAPEGPNHHRDGGTWIGRSSRVLWGFEGTWRYGQRNTTGGWSISVTGTKGGSLCESPFERAPNRSSTFDFRPAIGLEGCMWLRSCQVVSTRVWHPMLLIL